MDLGDFLVFLWLVIVACLFVGNYWSSKKQRNQDKESVRALCEARDVVFEYLDPITTYIARWQDGTQREYHLVYQQNGKRKQTLCLIGSTILVDRDNFILLDPPSFSDGMLTSAETRNSKKQL